MRFVKTERLIAAEDALEGPSWVLIVVEKVEGCVELS